MKKYVVIDTNVLVSALITRNENAPTVKILKYLSQNKIIPVYSLEIVKEYYEVLRREKFKLSEEIVSAVIKDIVNNGLEVGDTVEVKEEIPDPKMETAFARVTAKAVALPYEDRVKLLAVLAKSMAKPVSYASKKEDKNWSKMLDSYTGCMAGLWANEEPVEYQRRLRIE